MNKMFVLRKCTPRHGGAQPTWPWADHPAFIAFFKSLCKLVKNKE